MLISSLLQTRDQARWARPGGHSNTYLVTLPDFAVLVDTGSRPIIDRVKHHLAESGPALTDLAFIVLTHSHYDHVCGAGAIRAESGAKVVAPTRRKRPVSPGATHPSRTAPRRCPGCSPG